MVTRSTPTRCHCTVEPSSAVRVEDGVVQAEPEVVPRHENRRFTTSGVRAVTGCNGLEALVTSGVPRLAAKVPSISGVTMSFAW